MLTRYLLLVVHSFFTLSAAFFGGSRTVSHTHRLVSMSDNGAKPIPAVMKKLSGKILVSGIGSNNEDEFMLNLLNEQVQCSLTLNDYFKTG